MKPIGLLPLYLQLYDDALPEMRPRIEAFSVTIRDWLTEAGLEIVAAPVCRVSAEVREALAGLRDTAAIITLHLSYSPSLESAELLAAMPQPLILLDTTPLESFDETADHEEILYNHGIHGVQDLANLLTRYNKAYRVVAGHWQDARTTERIVGLARAAQAAQAWAQTRVGRIGPPFVGMGDFQVPENDLLDWFGHPVVRAAPDELRAKAEAVTDAQIKAEWTAVQRRFSGSDAIPWGSAVTSLRAGLAVRSWLEANRLSAYSLNFQAIDRNSGLTAVPFLEAGLAMARGIGYAGEGDVLTAALCASVMVIAPHTTFSEMFCPDWRGGRILLSHMGELNPDCAVEPPRLLVMDYPYSDAEDPLIACGALAEGPAVLVNLAPLGDGRLRLILAEVDIERLDDKLEKSIRGWMRPRRPLTEFLEAYSVLAGTHHLLIAYGILTESLEAYGEQCGFDVAII